MEKKTPEERLRNTYEQVIGNAYIRVMAASSGREFADINPHERVAILMSFEDAIQADVDMLVEVGQQYRLLGVAVPTAPEHEEPGLVLDSDEEPQ